MLNLVLPVLYRQSHQFIFGGPPFLILLKVLRIVYLDVGTDDDPIESCDFPIQDYDGDGGLGQLHQALRGSEAIGGASSGGDRRDCH